jgi:acyl-CoA synthetase (AMP-forming)/AMP-acid ligase II
MSPMYPGRMMEFPLTITHFLDRARAQFSEREIVTRLPDRSLHRYRYADFHRRALRLASALRRLGVGDGDRVATLCWNHYQHLEAYFAIPAMGAVCHTLNLRLHPDELAYIANHAGDKVLIVDRSLVPLWEKIKDRARSVERVIVVPDDYEALIDREPDDFVWPQLDEKQAAMICYTSGTTGNPKGVVYSHRSTVLHTMGACLADTIAVREVDSALIVVPMFHAAAWGLPFGAVMVGAKLVLPGPFLDAESLLDLMAGERVTLAGGVPTIWLGILALLDQNPKKWDLSAVTRMVVGGSAAPPSMIDGFARRHGIQILHAWGMTEMNPLGTLAHLKSAHRDRPDAEKLEVRASQGYPAPLVEIRHVDDGGGILPWDGKTMGELEVRGPWVAASYLGDEGKDRFTKDGWFKTGDVVTIDPQGYVRITDRSKDVVKSGGEWISSVALENALMSHPAVLEAAVFARLDLKWAERPVAAVVFKPGASATPEELRAHIVDHFPKFWLPDEYIVVPQIPRTSTGKFQKSKLREMYGELAQSQVQAQTQTQTQTQKSG